MDENLINKYAFEIFSRVKIFEIEFKIFQTEERLKRIETEGPSSILQKMDIEDRDFHNRVLLFKSEIGSYKLNLEKLQSQLQQFKESKKITN
ncbi:MAG: hypothetical protein WCJ74_02810 [bacterium]